MQNPEYVGVRIGQTSIVPVEFCIVEPGQVYKRRLPADVQRKFIELAVQEPNRRRRDIEVAISDGVSTLRVVCISTQSPLKRSP